MIVARGRTANGGFTFAQGTRAYYASLASVQHECPAGPSGAGAADRLHVEDNGVAWSKPGDRRSGQGFTFNDKEAIWVDKNPRSAYFGRVYVSWTQFRGIPGCAEPVMFAYSGDGGATWSRPNQITARTTAALGGGRAASSGQARRLGLPPMGGHDQSGPIQAVAVSS